MKIKLGLGRLSADKVAEICDGTLYTVACENKVVFETVCTDSREADNTSMFVAIRGEKVDGYSFIPNVVKAGCRCIIAERVPLDVKGVAVIVVEDSVRAIKAIAEYVKSQVDIKTVAVTGSVGKTTTKEFISAVLNRKYNLYKTNGNFNSTIGMPMSMLELSQRNDAADARKGEIIDRIRFYCQMMNQMRYFIISDCKETIQAFDDAVWEEDKDDVRLDDGSTNIDSLDAQEYSSEPFMRTMIDLRRKGQ